ncbi:TPA: hypothetical protein ACX6NV_000557 [Photobacterium damselae]
MKKKKMGSIKHGIMLALYMLNNLGKRGLPRKDVMDIINVSRRESDKKIISRQSFKSAVDALTKDGFIEEQLMKDLTYRMYMTNQGMRYCSPDYVVSVADHLEDCIKRELDSDASVRIASVKECLSFTLIANHNGRTANFELSYAFVEELGVDGISNLIIEKIRNKMCDNKVSQL